MNSRQWEEVKVHAGEEEGQEETLGQRGQRPV
jgi:hypothetical protein